MMGNWGFTVLANMLFSGRYSDLCYGYNAFWRRVLDDLALDGDGFEIETMMNVRALRAGLKIAEVPSFEAPRVHGSSNLRTFPDGWRVLKTLIGERLRPQAPRQAKRADRAPSKPDRAARAAARKRVRELIPIRLHAFVLSLQSNTASVAAEEHSTAAILFKWSAKKYHMNDMSQENIIIRSYTFVISPLRALIWS